MLTTNFQRPERTKLLWIYEGLTQYLGELLTVRSGLLTPEEYLPALANKVDFLLNQEGRQWRSLEDTAVAAHLGRARSPAWAQLRRSQDYYDEGLIIWLEADALIRAQTNGKKTLDDFCQRFFEARPEGPLIAPYELPQVTSLLNELVEYDWNEFFAERIAQPRPTLNLEFFPKNLGHRLQYGAKASDFTTEREKERKQSNLLASIGLSVGEDGSVQAVRIGSAADRAGLANGMTITAVNQRKFSSQRLKDAVAESVTSRKIDLLVLEGDEFRSRSLSYAEGSRFLEIVRHSEAPDTLGSILRPTSRAAAPATR
jgi:predicted metalloprotease with PDZ domain